MAFKAEFPLPNAILITQRYCLLDPSPFNFEGMCFILNAIITRQRRFYVGPLAFKMTTDIESKEIKACCGPHTLTSFS